MSQAPPMFSTPLSSYGGRENTMASSKLVRISGANTTSRSQHISGESADQDKSGLDEASRIIEVLQTNRNLLANNIILNDEFLLLLKDHKVIPGPMVADIKSLEDREEANTILLQYVGRLGPATFYRFCDVLGLTGHVFLCEHIKAEADQPDSSNRSELYEDVFRKYPAILKVLAPGEQRGLTTYVRDKVTDGIIKTQWKTRTAGDSKISDERNRKVTDSINKDRVIKEKDVEIRKLTGLLEDERSAHRATQTLSEELETKCHDIQVKYNEQLKIMMDSYQASERAHWETEQRLTVFDRQIKGLNSKIQIYFGTEEYSAMNDASNVKVSKLETNVEMVLNQLTEIEKEHRQLLSWYEEQRRKLFEALGLDDNGQDLRTAYLNAQEKINSEVRRLTAEVDLLSMTFDLNSIWSVLETEREKKEEQSGGKKKAKGTENLKTDVNVLKTAAAKSKEMAANFDYATVLHMVKERLHQVHIEIEKLKRQNLGYERKVGQLEGQLNLIRMRGFMDDPSQVDSVEATSKPAKPQTNTNTKGGKAGNTKAPPPNKRTPRSDLTPRRDPKSEELNKKAKLPPIYSTLTRDEPLDSKDGSASDGSESDSSEDMSPPMTIKIEERMPPIPESEGRTPRLERDSGPLTSRNDPPQDTGTSQRPPLTKRKTKDSLTRSSKDRTSQPVDDDAERDERNTLSPSESRPLELQRTVTEIELELHKPQRR